MESGQELPRTIPELVALARQNLTADLWDYGTGGADGETTLRRNRSAFDYLALRPRVLRNVSTVDLSTTFLGQTLSLPVMLAPVGSIEQFHPQGALACARPAHQAGTTAFIGSLSSPVLEEVRAGSDGPLYFQIYISGDRAWFEDIVKRAETAGYAGICVTVDSASYSRRERDIHNRFVPMGGSERPNLRGLGGAARRKGVRMEATITWDDLEWIRASTKLPMMLKGIQTAEDATMAVDSGIDVIYLSNHGGRQLDHASSTIELLPEIVQAVKRRASVIVDSGFMRGTDVVKAIALGADAVLIGKLMLYALGAAGEEGLAQALEILRLEIQNVMASIGAATVAELNPSFVRPTFPPGSMPWPYYPG